MIKVSRRDWGARPPKNSPQGINTRSATGHWEGTQMGSFPHASCATKMRVIQNYHMDTQGWNDIAYNFAVCPHGFVFIGRDHGIRSSANGTNAGNSESEAVCYLGGLGDPFTNEGKQAFSEIMHEISNVMYCHNKWFNTMCPGPEICNYIKQGCPPFKFPPVPPTKITHATTGQAGSMITLYHPTDPIRADDVWVGPSADKEFGPVMHRWYGSGGWSTPEDLGGSAKSVSASWKSDSSEFRIVVEGTDGAYENIHDVSIGKFRGWTRLNVEIHS